MTKSQERKARKQEEFLQDQRNSITSQLLAAPAGRDYLFWLMSIGGLAGNPFNPDPIVMAYNCGTRYVGEELQAHIVSLNPEAYALMLKEQADAARRAEPDPSADDRPDPELPFADAGG